MVCYKAGHGILVRSQPYDMLCSYIYAYPCPESRKVYDPPFVFNLILKRMTMSMQKPVNC